MSETKKRSSRIFLYVPHAWVEKAVEVGWESPSADGPPNNGSAILMEWKKDGEPVMPFRSRSREQRSG